jgi:hypothetical protein
MNESNHELVRNYGMPGATAVAVIRTIEEERLSEIDKSKIAILWRSKYIELSSNNTDPGLTCKFQSLAGIILNGHIKFKHEVSIIEADNYGKNYNYVKIAINILKRDYGSRWPDKLKETELWGKVFTELKRDPISYNSQLHVLKALVENGMIEGVNYM